MWYIIELDNVLINMHKLSHHFNLFLHCVNLFWQRVMLLCGIISSFKQAKMKSRLTYLLYCECMWEVAIVIKGCRNMYDLLAYLRRHHLKQYTELIEAQEKC